MQMLKHMTDPIKAIIRSKDGTRIAIVTITTVIPIRIIHLNKPRE